ncbi:hypothetical protein [Streptomyces sp. NPDC056242]|uniref:hypothetical protein n=1 Tax=Streptomyces sp. NPDC056242 TaxID=3345760 RepID=UPI0035DB4BD2
MFRRSKKAEDHDDWIVEQSASGGLVCWRVRWARIDEIFPEAVPALEQGARERGMTYRDYVTWVAALRKGRDLRIPGPNPEWGRVGHIPTCV